MLYNQELGFFPHSKPRGFLYKITKNGKTNHLHGSLHLPMESTALVSEQTKSAFEEAKLIIFENFMPDETEILLQQEKIKDQIVSWVVDNIDTLLTAKVNPYAIKIMSTIEHWNHEELPIIAYEQAFDAVIERTDALKEMIPLGEPGIESQFYIKANELHKPCAGLEIYSEAKRAHFGLDLSCEEQLEVVCHFLPQLEDKNIELMLNTMKAAYISHDLAKLMTITCAKFVNPLKIPAVDKYVQKFVHERDEIMALNAEKYLEEGDAFITVGASHLVGITEILSGKGFTVEPIYEGPLVHSISEFSRPLELSLNGSPI